MHYHRRKGVSRSCSEWKRGGATLLWSSSVTGCRVVFLRDAPANWKKHTASDQYGSASSGYEGVERGLRCTSILRSVVNNLTHYNLKGYRIKPHGQLVLVSYMHYCTSTPSLSTSWSRLTLQGQAPGYLIFRRVSRLDAFSGYLFPYVATRQCHWHDKPHQWYVHSGPLVPGAGSVK